MHKLNEKELLKADIARLELIIEDLRSQKTDLQKEFDEYKIKQESVKNNIRAERDLYHTQRDRARHCLYNIQKEINDGY